MNPQFLADGILTGALLGLGGVGLTLAYSILRFANFVHGDFLTVGAAAPLQAAGAAALAMPEVYYRELAEKYAERRSMLLAALRRIGFKAYRPGGAYYIMTDIAPFASGNDKAFAYKLVSEIGVAAVPGSSFYRTPGGGLQQIRFVFCKQMETLERAIANLEKLVRPER